jgi:hypothetical protein
VSENPAGLYVNSVVQGMVLALLVVALVSERMWLWVPLLLPGLLLSGSRGAWLALAIGLLSVYVRRAWVFGLLGVAGLALILHVQPMSSDETRLLIWNGALHFLTPWGWGPGSMFSWLLPYRDTLITPEYAHNDAIQLVFEYGVAAVLPSAFSGSFLHKPKPASGRFLSHSLRWAATQCRCGRRLRRFWRVSWRAALLAAGLYMGLSAMRADFLAFHGGGAMTVKKQAMDVFPWSRVIRQGVEYGRR